MDRTENDLTGISFRKDFSYAKKTPTFVSNSIGGTDEIARWILDWNDVLYNDERHAPPLSIPVIGRLTGEKGHRSGPVLIKTDVLLYTAESIIVYFEQRCLPEKRLLPVDADRRKEVISWYNLFTGPFEGNVSRYVYAQLLESPGSARSWFTKGAPLGEKLEYGISFGAMRRMLTREWRLAEKPAGAEPYPLAAAAPPEAEAASTARMGRGNARPAEAPAAATVLVVPTTAATATPAPAVARQVRARTTPAPPQRTATPAAPVPPGCDCMTPPVPTPTAPSATPSPSDSPSASATPTDSEPPYPGDWAEPSEGREGFVHPRHQQG